MESRDTSRASGDYFINMATSSFGPMSNNNRKRELDESSSDYAPQPKRNLAETNNTDESGLRLSPLVDEEARRRKAAEFERIITLRNNLVANLISSYGECLPHEKWGVMVDRVNVDGKELPTGLSVLIILDNKPLIGQFAVIAQIANNGFEAQLASDLSMLPPIRVVMQYPNPEAIAPNIELDCSWLGESQVMEIQTRMRQEFDDVFDGEQCIPAINAAINFLHTETWAALDITANGTVTILRNDFQQRRSESGLIYVRDPARVFQMFQEINAETRNIVMAGLNPSSTFQCEICFNDRQSYAAVIFPECRHHFCRPCVADAFAVKINEHTVQSFSCLSCSSTAPPAMISTVLPKPIYDKYKAIQNDQLLDNTEGIFRCTRCRNAINLAQMARPSWKNMACKSCKFRFCLTCKKPSHPHRSCFTNDAVKDIQARYLQASEIERRQMQRQYGVKNVRHAVVNVESEAWISKHVKACPNCNCSIQKSEGCNHMKCPRCSTDFCWLCREVLPATDPYLHFRTTNCKTFTEPITLQVPNRNPLPQVRFGVPAVFPRMIEDRGYLERTMQIDRRRNPFPDRTIHTTPFPQPRRVALPSNSNRDDVVPPEVQRRESL